MDNTKNIQKKNLELLNIITNIIKPQIIAILITAIVFIGMAILLTYTDFDESKVSTISLICTAVATLISGFDTAASFGKKGFIWGAISGIIYSFIIFIICILSGADFTFDFGKLTTIIISIAGGMIGGVLGVNTKSNKH